MPTPRAPAPPALRDQPMMNDSHAQIAPRDLPMKLIPAGGDALSDHCLCYVKCGCLIEFILISSNGEFVTGLSFVCHSASHPLPGQRKTEENCS